MAVEVLVAEVTAGLMVPLEGCCARLSLWGGRLGTAKTGAEGGGEEMTGETVVWVWLVERFLVVGAGLFGEGCCWLLLITLAREGVRFGRGGRVGKREEQPWAGSQK